MKAMFEKVPRVGAVSFTRHGSCLFCCFRVPLWLANPKVTAVSSTFTLTMLLPLLYALSRKTSHICQPASTYCGHRKVATNCDNLARFWGSESGPRLCCHPITRNEFGAHIPGPKTVPRLTLFETSFAVSESRPCLEFVRLYLLHVQQVFPTEIDVSS